MRLRIILLLFTSLVISSSADARQLTGGGFDGDGPVADVPGNVSNETPTTGGVTGGGGGGQSGSDGMVEPTVLDLGGDIEDTRNQGFVGATSVGIQERGFVGATSENSGPPLSDGGTFGGGVNGSGTQAGGGGGRQGGGFGNGLGGFNGGFGGQGLGGAGTQNGFVVIRQNLRTNLVPRFYAPAVNGQQTAIRFQQRIARQPMPIAVASPSVAMPGGIQLAPAMQLLPVAPMDSVQVIIENRTATLIGRTETLEERDRWERQLRLEPGVDRIVNQIEVSN
jgi:hypothetical protein